MSGSVSSNEGVTTVPVSPNGKGVLFSAVKYMSSEHVAFETTRTSKGGMAFISSVSEEKAWPLWLAVSEKKAWPFSLCHNEGGMTVMPVSPSELDMTNVSIRYRTN